MKNKNGFHKLQGREMDYMYKHSKMCGYHRLPKINANQSKITGKCSITGDRCTYSPPLRTYDCPTAQTILNGLEKKL